MKHLLLLLLLAGCTNMNMQQNSEHYIYKGVLPAADCSGIEYELKIDNKELSYTLVSTYLDAEGDGKHISFKSDGKIEIISPSGIDKYYKLDSANPLEALNFKIINDTTLCLVNSDLEMPSSPENYIINRVKE
ncbi:MAG: copper resistance protein NlpE N-terminal domain-containing protein [Bacteroidaceae bacterium]|nr:copper resistance protein NlpE N-terminal domain-containing protein [Bacteroidaceae bacterium]